MEPATNPPNGTVHRAAVLFVLYLAATSILFAGLYFSSPETNRLQLDGIFIYTMRYSLLFIAPFFLFFAFFTWTRRKEHRRTRDYLYFILLSVASTLPFPALWIHHDLTTSTGAASQGYGAMSIMILAAGMTLVMLVLSLISSALMGGGGSAESFPKESRPDPGTGGTGNHPTPTALLLLYALLIAGPIAAVLYDAQTRTTDPRIAYLLGGGEHERLRLGKGEWEWPGAMGKDLEAKISRLKELCAEGRGQPASEDVFDCLPQLPPDKAERALAILTEFLKNGRSPENLKCRIVREIPNLKAAPIKKLDALNPAMSDVFDAVRREAARSLTRLEGLDDAHLLPALLAALENRDLTVRRLCAFRILGMQAEFPLKLQALKAAGPGHQENAKVQAEVEAEFQKVIGKLETGNNDRRIEAVLLKAWRGTPATPGSGDIAVLRRSGPQVVAVLKPLLRSGGGSDPDRALDILGAMGAYADSAVPAVLATFAWEENGYPDKTLCTLMKIGTPAALKAVGEYKRGLEAGALKRDNPAARVYSLCILARFGSSAVPTIVKGIDEGDLETAATAVRALELIGPGAGTAVPALRKTFLWKGGGFPQNTYWALLGIGTPEALAAAKELKDSPAGKVLTDDKRPVSETCDLLAGMPDCVKNWTAGD